MSKVYSNLLEENQQNNGTSLHILWKTLNINDLNSPMKRYLPNQLKNKTQQYAAYKKFISPAKTWKVIFHKQMEAKNKQDQLDV